MLHGLARRGDVLITNCNTLMQFRRQGLYAASLRNLSRMATRTTSVYINTSPDNSISLRGIEAASYERLGTFRYWSLGPLTLHRKKLPEQGTGRP
jgi:hypothetical protein